MAAQKTTTNNGKGKIAMIVVLAIAIVAVAAYVLTGDMRTYSQAVKLEKAASYDEAIAVYETIPDYKDATTRINECKYQQALALEKAGKYGDAQAAFEALGEYSDSVTHVNECKYQQALALEKAEIYADAQAAFKELGKYSDSVAHENECKYQQALALEKAESYADAQAAFEALGKYSDSATHVTECKFQQALALEAAGSYAEAQIAFEAISEYSDAPTHVNECKYQQALALEKSGKYADAQVAFEALGEYSDSVTHVNECKYQQALTLEKSVMYAEAQTAFEALGGYLDSPTHVKECKYQQALASEAAGKYAEAQVVFEKIGEYSDAPTHVNACKYQQALVAEVTGSAAEALTAFTALGDYKDSVNHAYGIQVALSKYDTEVARVETQEDTLDMAISSAETIIAEGKTPLDNTTIINLQAAIVTAVESKKELPTSLTVLSDIIATTETLQLIDYASSTERVLGAKTALEDSIKQYEFVVAPEEAFIIDRLSRVPDIAYIAAVTEDNDPNNQLGKAGGYTAQIYFSSTLVSSNYAKMPNMDVIEAGTDCGGSIEVYATVKDAERRNTYLGSFDGTALASGSHTVVGTIIVRTSNSLKASQQKTLEAEIIEALTSLNPGPIIVRSQVVEEETSEGAQKAVDAPAAEEPVTAKAEPTKSPEGTVDFTLVSVKEVGYDVENGWLHYAVILQNNSSDTVIQFPEFRLISRDAKGDLLGVETQVLSALYPNQNAVWASLGGEVSEMPASVEVEFVEPEYYNLVSPSKLEHPEYIPLEIQGASLKKGNFNTTLIGEVYNPNSYDISMAEITIVFRDKAGNLMAGCNGYCDGVKAGAKAAFEVYVQNDLIGETFEVYAMPW